MPFVVLSLSLDQKGRNDPGALANWPRMSEYTPGTRPTIALWLVPNTPHGPCLYQLQLQTLAQLTPGTPCRLYQL